jgi:hypothetical protein
LLLHDDLARKEVNVYASLAKNVDSMMSIQYSSIWPALSDSLAIRAAARLVTF